MPKPPVDRNWLISTKEFTSDTNGKLIALKTVQVEWIYKAGQRPILKEVSGTEKIWPCELVLLALGFTGPETTLSKQLGIETNIRSNYIANDYQTNIHHIFTAGDMHRG